MSSELVEIQQSILKFTFEVRKQSSCQVQLTNKTDQFIAFKVKTTSPKKYVVKPNIHVMKPKGSSEFTVFMLAQSVAPPDLICKDKFLIQSTIVPFGLTEENVTSEMFVKGPNRHIEEKKLKVILVAPVNTTETSVSLLASGDQKQDLTSEASPQKDKMHTETQRSSLFKDGEGSQSKKATEEMRFTKDAESRPAEDMKELRISRGHESSEVQKPDMEKVPNVASDLRIKKEAEELSLKINGLGSKLAEAEQTAAQLIEERNRILHEKELIEQELALARRKNVVKKVYRGYPLLYVFMTSLFSLTFGYLMRQ